MTFLCVLFSTLQIERERKGEATDRSMLRSLVRMLQSVGLYKSPFEGRLIEETENFYGAEGVRYMEQVIDTSDQQIIVALRNECCNRSK